MTPLAFVAPNLLGPFASGLRDHLARLNHGLMERIVGDDPAGHREALRKLLRRESPKSVICVSMRPDAETLAMYRALNVTVVLIDEYADRVASVSCDNFKGGYLAGRHLIDRGHSRIALICGRLNRPGSANADARRDGLRKALAEAHGSLLNVDCWEVDDYSEDDGVEWHHHRPPDSTAVFCAAGDRCASGVMSAAAKLGMKIPKDLAIVGFDDSAIAGVLGLTTIRQPLKEMSETAYRMAVIEPSRTLARPERVVLAPELVLRETT